MLNQCDDAVVVIDGKCRLDAGVVLQCQFRRPEVRFTTIIQLQYMLNSLGRGGLLTDKAAVYKT